MKLSEFLKQYSDELINKYDDCDLDDLTGEQKEELMYVEDMIEVGKIKRLLEINKNDE